MSENVIDKETEEFHMKLKDVMRAESELNARKNELLGPFVTVPQYLSQSEMSYIEKIKPTIKDLYKMDNSTRGYNLMTEHERKTEAMQKEINALREEVNRLKNPHNVYVDPLTGAANLRTFLKTHEQHSSQ